VCVKIENGKYTLKQQALMYMHAMIKHLSVMDVRQLIQLWY